MDNSPFKKKLCLIKKQHFKCVNIKLLFSTGTPTKHKCLLTLSIETESNFENRSKFIPNYCKFPKL